MSSRRLHFILLGLICLLTLGLLVGTYGVSKLLAKESTKLVNLKAKSQALDQEKIILKKAKRDIVAYSGLERITRAIVPEDKSQAEVVGELTKIANLNGVPIGSITFIPSTLGAGAAGAAGGATTPAAAAPTTGAATTPATGGAAAASNKLTQIQPVKNIPGVYQLPITVSSPDEKPVPYNKFIAFLSDLEQNRRTAQVSSIQVEPDFTTKDSVKFTIVINGYIKP